MCLMFYDTYINIEKYRFLANINACAFWKAYEFWLVIFIALRYDMKNNHT